MSSPHIGLAAIGGQGWMGGAHYVRNLAAAIQAAAPETRISWLCGAGLEPEWQDVAPRFTIPAPDRLTRWWDRRASTFRQVLEKSQVDFLYPLTYDNTYNLSLPFPLSPALGTLSWAGWIPDFQHRYLPELFTERELHWREEQMSLLAAEAPRIVLSSRTALHDFQRFFPQHADKAALLTFRVQPVEPHDDQALLGEVPERFFLVCNQFWKHKNHGLIFAALRILRDRGLRPPVLCTGALQDYRSDPYAASLRAQLEEDGLGAQVQVLGLIPRERQVALLRRALAVVQPSLFEGWSTVVEDARTFGRPCLLSDLPVHREQNPPGARYFSPDQPEALAELLQDVWQTFPPGPDAALAATAYELAQQQQREFGHQFLHLAGSRPALNSVQLAPDGAGLSRSG